MFSAETRTRRPSDTLERVERAEPLSDPERPRIEGRLKFEDTVLDHVAEVRLFSLKELVVVLLRRDVELVLRLGLRRLEGAGQDAPAWSVAVRTASNSKKKRPTASSDGHEFDGVTLHHGTPRYAHLHVPNFLRHLGMAHVLVDDDALDQLRLLQAPAGLALHLDQIEVHVRVVADALRYT